MQTSQAILKERLQSLKELQASALDLLFSGRVSQQELEDILELIPQLQREAVQVEAALNLARNVRDAS